MKKSFVMMSGIIALVSAAILMGCTPRTQNADEAHLNDMLAKEAKGQTTGTVATTDVLMPADEQQIVSEEVEYASGVMGYLSYPENNPAAPGVVVIHEWRGLNDHIKDMTKVLAANGYAALAVDLYNGDVAETAQEAQGLVGSVEQDAATTNLLAAENRLRQNQDSERVASLGRCFGGKQSLQLSLASDTLDATVIYYGQLETDEDTLEAINQPILGIFAENDNGIPPSQVRAFEEALETIGKEKDITIYDDVDHAFANPTGSNYSPAATRDAWQKTLNFLEENLQ